MELLTKKPLCHAVGLVAQTQVRAVLVSIISSECAYLRLRIASPEFAGSWSFLQVRREEEVGAGCGLWHCCHGEALRSLTGKCFA